MKTALAIVTLSLMSLSLAGCTGGDDKYVAPPMDDDGQYIIRMVNSKFVPQYAEVPVGATVVWMNEDRVQHNVKADDGSFGSLITSGDPDDPVPNHVQVFDTAGTYGYVCQPHQSIGMKGEVRVIE